MRSIPAMSTMPTTNVLSAFFPNRRQQRVLYQNNNTNNMIRDLHYETENMTPNRQQQQNENHESHYESTSEDEMIQLKKIVNKVDNIIVASAATTPSNNSSTAATTSIRDIIDETYNDMKTKIILGNDNTMTIQASPYHQQHIDDDDDSTVETATTATTTTMSSTSSHSTQFMLLLSANASIQSELSLSSSFTELQTPVIPHHVIVSQQQQQQCTAVTTTDDNYLPLEILYSNDQWDIKNQWGFDYDDDEIMDDTDSLSSSDDDDDDDFFGNSNNNIFDNTPFDVINHNDSGINYDKYCNNHRVVHRRLNHSYDECFASTPIDINYNDNIENIDKTNMVWTIQHAQPIIVVDDNDDNM